MRTHIKRSAAIAGVSAALVTACLGIAVPPAANAIPASSVSATVTVPSSPKGIVATEDGKKIYVAGDAGYLTVIDGMTQAVKAQIAFSGSSYDLALSPDGKYVWMTSYTMGKVYKVSTVTDSIVGTYSVSSGVWGIAFDSTGTVYLSRRTGATGASISPTGVVNLTMPWSYATSIAISGDGLTMYSGRFDGYIYKYTRASLSSAFTLSTSVSSSLYANPYAMALSADGSRLAIAGVTNGVLITLNTSNLAKVSQVTGTGGGLQEVVLGSDGNFYAASNSGITIYDTALTKVGFIATPGFASSVALSNNGSRMYAAQRLGTKVYMFTPPAGVTSVFATSTNGKYGPGSTVDIKVTYDGAVAVTGTPTLALNVGSTPRYATYVSGSGTAALVFRYTVQPGDSAVDLDYASSSAIDTAGGSILSTSGTTVSSALPTPGSPSSLAGNSDIVIGNSVPAAPVLTIVRGGAALFSTAATLGADNGAPITSVEYSLDGGTTWTTTNQTSGNFTVNGLTNGTTYNVAVRAVNSEGPSPASNTISVTPGAVPLPPTGVTATPGDGTIDVTSIIGNLAATGGYPVTNVDYSLDGGTTWTATNQTSGNFTISGLTNGTTYSLKVRLKTYFGTGTASSAVSVRPVSVPSAPVVSAATVNSRSVSVESALGSANGGTISDVEYSLNGGTTWVSTGQTTGNFTISNLTNGTTYNIKVRSVSQFGSSPASNAISATPASNPEAPTAVVLTPGNGTVTVSSTLGDTGGFPVSDVEYSLNGGTTWVSTGQTTGNFTISNLTNGTTYSVQVRVKTTYAAGASSAAASVQPRSVPSVSVLGTPVAGNKSATIGVTLGDNGGAPITDVQYSLSGGAWLSSGNVSSLLSIGGLVNGTTYNVRVRTVNAAGTSAISNTVVFTPATAPDAPIVTRVIPGNHSIATKVALGDNGGFPVTQVEYSLNNGEWTAATLSADTLNIGELTNGANYAVRVRVKTSVGYSDASNSMTTFPRTTPAAPELVSATAGKGVVNVVANLGDDGGAIVSDVQYSLDGGTTWVSTAQTTGTFRISGLSNGVTQRVAVRAVNTAGASTQSSVVEVTPNQPGLVTSFAVGGVTSSSINLTWAPPSVGQAVDHYNVVNSVSKAVLATVPGTEHSANLSNLSRGAEYPVAVVAVAANGVEGELGEAINAATLSGSPSAPRGVAADITKIDDTRVVLDWEAPTSDGDAPITEYLIKDNRGGAWTSTETSLEVTGLAPNTSYLFYVSAKNQYGSSLAAPVVSTKTAATSDFAPVINGTVAYRSTLIATSPIAGVTYKWQRSEDATTWSDITGATKASYVPVASDMGYHIRVVTTKAGRSYISDQTNVIEFVAPSSMDVVKSPVGTPAVGSVLTAQDKGNWWANAAGGVTYQWQMDTADGLDFVDIPGANKAVFTPGLAQVGHRLRVQLTASNKAGNGAVYSRPTGTVANIKPTVATSPSISGGVKPGVGVLAVDRGGWKNLSVEGTRTVQWQAKVNNAWVDILGATGQTFAIPASQEGREVRAKVTAANGSALTATTVAYTNSKLVENLTPVVSVAPSVAGDAKVGETLSLNSGTWGGTLSTPVYSYQWERMNPAKSSAYSAIAGATGATYTPSEADSGNKVRVVVSAKNGGSTLKVVTAAVTVAPLPKVSVATAISKGGNTITATRAAYTGLLSDTRVVTWQISSNGTSWATIAGETKTTYTVKATDKGKSIRAVTSVAYGNRDVSSTSNIIAIS